MSKSEPPPVSARRLTARADWEAVADWCGGEMLVDVHDPDRLSVVQVPHPDGDGHDTAYRGDWIVHDDGGFVVVPARHADAILRAAREAERRRP